MGHADFGLGALLDAERWLFLVVVITAVYSRWWTVETPAWPKDPYALTMRIVWFLIKAGLVAGFFGYGYASLDIDHVTKYANLDDHAVSDWTWVLIIVHLLHLHANEAYSYARYYTAGYWISTVLFVLTILAAIAVSILGFYQGIWSTGIGYGVHALALIGVLVFYAFRYDRMKRNALRTAYNKAKGISPSKRQ